MASTLADSPPAGQPEPAVTPGATQPGGTGTPPPGQAAQAAPPPPAVAQGCRRCGAALLPGQDWCLQCGAGAPGSLGAPGWRPTLTVLGAVLVLVLGAAGAAYAALSEGSAKGHLVTTVVAQAPPPVSTTAPSTPTSPLPSTHGGFAHTPKVSKGLLGLGSAKPPKIPLTAVTPKASEKLTTPTTGTGTSKAGESTKKTTTPSGKTGTGTGSGKGQTGETNEESQQSAIELDTDAAQTYDPYEYPASWFGDPSLAIDDDPTTPWTAQVNPATAPAMAEGLSIDLKSKQKVSAWQLITTTPGMTVQVYGAESATQPTSITDPAWIPLSSPRVVKKHKLRLALRDSGKAFTFITLWISKAPKSAVGTPEAPGHVDVDEVELFPTS